MGPIESTQVPSPDPSLPPTRIELPSHTPRPETPSQAQARHADTPPSFQYKLPTSVGRYVVQGRLGVGGFADVYYAVDPELDGQVVIKVPRADRALNDSTTAELLNEARTAAQLQHSHIVTVHDVGRVSDQGVFIAMEHLAGGTLAQRLVSQPLPIPTTMRILAEVADGLHYAHQQGLIHRDLKPSNILFTRDGSPKVADFGLALFEASKGERQGEVSGTPAYMSPEQVRGDSHLLDVRSDLWSLGVILYECLAGAPPFQGTTTQAIYTQILTADPPPLRTINENIPDELEQLCLQCLSRDPARRPASAEEVAARLRHILKTYTQAGLTTRQKWLGLAGCVAGVVAVLSIAVWLSNRESRPRQPEPAGPLEFIESSLIGSAASGNQLALLTPQPMPEEYQLDRWNSLLRRPPRILAFDTNSLTNSYTHDATAGTLAVNTGDWAIFACGKTAPAQDVRLSLIRQSSQAAVAIFWGLHQVEGEIAEPNARTPPQLLKPGEQPETFRPAIPFVHRARALRIPYLGRDPDNTLLLIEEVTFYHEDRDSLFVFKAEALQRSNVPVGRGMEILLSLTLQQGQCTALQLNGTDVPIDATRQERGASEFASGELGFKTALGQIVVTDFSLKPLPATK